MQLAWPAPLILIALLLCTGCGFTLRGAPELPPHLQYMDIRGEKRHAPVVRMLKKRLASGQGQHGLAGPLPRLFLHKEKLNRRLLSLFSTGQVAEYELIYSLRYTLTLPGEAPREFKLELTREYQDDPDAVLAKSRELNLILGEMRQMAVRKIIAELATTAAGPAGST